MRTVQDYLAEIFNQSQPEDDAYINDVDKLIYCRACNTPRQTRIYPPGSSVPFCPPIKCRCQKEKQDREDALVRKHQITRQIEQLKREGLQDNALRRYTFDNDKGYTPQIKMARNYVEHFDRFEKRGEGLLLWGDVGSGKTFMAACIANELMNRCVPVLMTNFSRILLTLTGNLSEDKNNYLDNLNRYRLLIIDDLGIERNTDFALEQVFSVIDRRCQSGLPMIITTNIPISAIKHPEDIPHARIYDRILEHCLPIRITGNHIRQKKAAEQMQEFKDLLNTGM